MKTLRVLCGAAVFACVGCTVQAPVTITAQATVTQEKGQASKLQAFASTTTPPSGATMVGMQTNPPVGDTTIPVTNVAVYTFVANVDSDPADETLYWAVSGTTVYVWGKISLTCVDEQNQPTGETGDADFIFEADGDQQAWFTATDACGYTTHAGCASSGGSEVCGVCHFDAQAIVCAAAST